jgi:protection-of-telomeres protein 1
VASFPEIKLSSVAEILHNPSLKTKDAKGVDIVLPFVNAKYRTRIRVVDFFPHNLEDFARSMADPDWHTALKGTNSGDIRPSTRWEWGFVLLVESSNIPTGTTPERLRLFVNNPAGQHLLNMNASE